MPGERILCGLGIGSVAATTCVFCSVGGLGDSEKRLPLLCQGWLCWNAQPWVSFGFLGLNGFQFHADVIKTNQKHGVMGFSLAVYARI